MVPVIQFIGTARARMLSGQFTIKHLIIILSHWSTLHRLDTAVEQVVTGSLLVLVCLGEMSYFSTDSHRKLQLSAAFSEINS